MQAVTASWAFLSPQASTTVNFASGELRKQVSIAVASVAKAAIERFLASLSNGTGMTRSGRGTPLCVAG